MNNYSMTNLTPEDQEQKLVVQQLLGKQMKTIRLQKKMRQNVVAQSCGFNKSAYNVIENGKRNITIITLYKIAFALEEPIFSFFTEEDFNKLMETYKKDII